MSESVPTTVVLGLVKGTETRDMGTYIYTIGNDESRRISVENIVERYAIQHLRGSIETNPDWINASVIRTPVEKNLWYVGSTIAIELGTQGLPQHATVLPYIYADQHTWWNSLQGLEKRILANGDVRYLAEFEAVMESYWMTLEEGIVEGDINKTQQAYNAIMLLEPRTNDAGSLLRDVLKTRSHQVFLNAKDNIFDKL